MLPRVFVNNIIFFKIGQNSVLFTSIFLKTSQSGNFDFLKFVLYRPQNQNNLYEPRHEEIPFPKLVIRENFKFKPLAHHSQLSLGPHTLVWVSYSNHPTR